MKQATMLNNHADLSIDMLLEYDIDPLAIVTWSLINDRYGSSCRQEGNRFFDEKQNDYYAIFTNDELGRILKKSVNTITKYIKQLHDNGLLFKKKAFNGANKYFPILPDRFTKKRLQTALYHQSQFLCFRKPTFLGFNRFIFNRLEGQDLTSNTSNTRKRKLTSTTPRPQVIEKSKANPANKDSKPGIQNQEPDQVGFMNDIAELQNEVAKLKGITIAPTPVDTKDEKEKAFNELGLIANRDSLAKIIGDRAADTLKQLSFGNAQTLYEFGGLIFKAKKSVYKEFKQQNPQITELIDATRFEQNVFMSNSFNENITRIFKAGVKTADYDHDYRDRFIMKSLKNYFGDVFNEFTMAGNEKSNDEIIKGLAESTDLPEKVSHAHKPDENAAQYIKWWKINQPTPASHDVSKYLMSKHDSAKNKAADVLFEDGFVPGPTSLDLVANQNANYDQNVRA